SHAANANTRRYAVLGFDPDDLRYKLSAVGEQLRRDFRNDLPALCAFYRFCYWRIWQQQPMLMLKKIVRQMAVFYAPKCPAYRLAKSLPLSNAYQQGVASLQRLDYPKVWAAYLPASDFMQRTRSLVLVAPVLVQSSYIRGPLTVMALTFGHLIFVALLLVRLVCFL